MSHDIVIRGGQIVDGLLNRGYEGDVAIDGDEITVLGDDRGALEVGRKADINVLDIAEVEERQPQRVYDFPGGAPRLIQRGVGYRNTLVNGRVILEQNELTGERGGEILRNSSA